MNNFLDKEYHPVIEDFVLDYVDENMGSVERTTFEEVLVHDDDLRELAFSAKEGKRLLEQFRDIKANEGFLDRLLQSISSND
ncbi:MAG TPA: hypothetical protein DD671_16350 [Balneolaceae bacterium]|nr:hypothetical protein [Balneola sp.]HBQ61140.1 hypothetical protein [Balneolaceae bacterium]|tara:strand:+ start:754 stop:999 length:246 start_codon:yes stop_codon:yes gene_type:complete